MPRYVTSPQIKQTAKRKCEPLLILSPEDFEKHPSTFLRTKCRDKEWAAVKKQPLKSIIAEKKPLKSSVAEKYPRRKETAEKSTSVKSTTEF